MQRCLLPFVLLDQTAKDIVDGKDLSGDRVTIGIERKHLTKEALSTLRTFLPDVVHKTQARSFNYEPVGLPHYGVMPRVYVKIIRKKWDFLKRKDFKFHLAEEYQIPNPFKSYWKVRGLIK